MDQTLWIVGIVEEDHSAVDEVLAKLAKASEQLEVGLEQRRTSLWLEHVFLLSASIHNSLTTAKRRPLRSSDKYLEEDIVVRENSAKYRQRLDGHLQEKRINIFWLEKSQSNARTKKQRESETDFKRVGGGLSGTRNEVPGLIHDVLERYGLLRFAALYKRDPAGRRLWSASVRKIHAPTGQLLVFMRQNNTQALKTTHILSLSPPSLSLSFSLLCRSSAVLYPGRLDSGRKAHDARQEIQRKANGPRRIPEAVLQSNARSIEERRMNLPHHSICTHGRGGGRNHSSYTQQAQKKEMEAAPGGSRRAVSSSLRTVEDLPKRAVANW